MTNREARLKRLKRVKLVKRLIVADIAALVLTSALLVAPLGINNDSSYTKDNKIHEVTDIIQYRSLNELRQVKLPTTTQRFDGVKYQVANEEDILKLSREFSFAIEEYFKSCGAIHWTNNDNQQFWPKDVEYMVTAIAFRESTYRTDVINEKGCKGLTCLKEEELLKTLREEWLVTRIWEDNIPNVNCNPDEVDMFNGTTCIEYTYYNIGYNLANRFKKDKYFTDVDGERRCVWNVLDYSEETQNRLIIATHLFGIDNITNSVFGRANSSGKVIAIDKYLYCDYVEDVMDKMQELKNNYEQNFTMG